MLDIGGGSTVLPAIRTTVRHENAPPPSPATLRELSWTPGRALSEPLDLGVTGTQLPDLSALTAATPVTTGLALVTVPASSEEQPVLAEAARAALLARADQDTTTVTLLGLQGAHLVIAPGWVVVLAVAERLEPAAAIAAATCSLSGPRTASAQSASRRWRMNTARG